MLSTSRCNISFSSMGRIVGPCIGPLQLLVSAISACVTAQSQSQSQSQLQLQLQCVVSSKLLSTYAIHPVSMYYST